METLEQAYTHLFYDEIPEAASERPAVSSAEEFIQSQQEKYLNAEFNTIRNLCALGYDPAIVEKWVNSGHSKFREALNSRGQSENISAAVTAYESKLIPMLQEYHEKVSAEQKEDAAALFSKLREAFITKLADTTVSDDVLKYQDGEIALELMEHGYSYPAILNSLQNICGYNIIDSKQILADAGYVKLLYRDINNAKKELIQCKNEHDVYRLFARHHIEHARIRHLDFEDDVIIAKDMKKLGLPDELIKSAISRCSPVLSEPSRNKEDYLTSIHTAVNTKEPDFTPKQDVNEAYLSCSEKLVEKLKTKGLHEDVFNDYRTYYDGIIVRDLLLQHYSDNEILSAINKLSPAVNKRPDYAEWLVKKIHKLIQKEQSLLDFTRELPSGQNSYKQLQQLGFTTASIYMSVLQQHIDLNPSITNKLYESFVDKNIVETCFNRFNDIDRNDLAKVLSESPRGILVNGTELSEAKDYSASVLAEVERRIKAKKAQDEKQKTITEEFNRSLGLSQQGIGSSNDIKNQYELGRAAIRMLSLGIDPRQVRESIIQSAAPEDISPLEFADNIMKSANASYMRQQAVIKYNPDEEQKNTAADNYMKKLHQCYKNRGFIKQGSDVDTIKFLLAQGWDKNELKEALLNHSPLAIVPGREPNSYTQYIFPKAEEALRQDKLNLQTFSLTPRADKEPTAFMEYNHFKIRMLNAFNLPMINPMHAIIVRALVKEDFPKEEIMNALKESEPQLSDDECNKIMMDAYSHDELNSGKSQDLTIGEEEAEVQTPVFKEQEDVQEPVKDETKDSISKQGEKLQENTVLEQPSEDKIISEERPEAEQQEIKERTPDKSSLEASEEPEDEDFKKACELINEYSALDNDKDRSNFIANKVTAQREKVRKLVVKIIAYGHVDKKKEAPVQEHEHIRTRTYSDNDGENQ